MARRRKRQHGSSLFALYVLASLVPIAVIGVVSMRSDTTTGTEFTSDWGRAQSAVIEQMAVAPALRGGVLSSGLTSAERDRLQSATDLAIFNGTVSHLRLRSFNGAVVFSDDGSVTDPVPVSDPAFRAAAAGGTDVRVIKNAQNPSGAVRVMQPVIAAANGQATGVLEVYLPYDAIATKVAADTRAQIIRFAISLVGLFAFLALISWWTTRALRQSAATHEHQSLHDSLTGLPNRELFRRRAEQALERGRRGEQGALVLLDLDHFKEVNDTLGHHAGDELLRVVARRLRESLRTDDTVARLGGDEFAMVLPLGGDRGETLALLRRIRAELGAGVVLEGVSVSVTASFGVCFYPESADNLEDLLRHADAAMYLGKQEPDGIVIYEAATPHHASQAPVIARELALALDRDELVLHYQPMLKLGSGAVIALEALVRWQHPQRGLLAPGEFLPLAQSSELIEALTSWVLRRALADYQAWTSAGHHWSVAVNVSPTSLRSQDFADRVGQILRETGVPPGQLHLEVSQGALACDAESGAAAIGGLAAQGIWITIKDFGMDLQDLAQFWTAGVREVKIDARFAADLPGNKQDRALVRSVIALGHDLGCLVTAHGVPSQDVADAMADAGCDHAQGDLWLYPGPWTEVARVFGPAAPLTTPAATAGSVAAASP